jgi:hypothetical protein
LPLGPIAASAQSLCGRDQILAEANRPAVADTKLEDLKQRASSLSRCVPSSARRSKNAARLKREIEFDRQRPAHFNQQIIDTVMVNS